MNGSPDQLRQRRMRCEELAESAALQLESLRDALDAGGMEDSTRLAREAERDLRELASLTMLPEAANGLEPGWSDPGSLHAFRRAVEKGTPALEIEEYSHFGMVARMSAGAARLPFWVMRNYMGTDLPVANPRIKTVTCPYTGEVLATVPALNPDVTIIAAQRADQNGNAQVWGLLGVQKEAAFASKRVIVVVEELVDESVIRADPNRTLIPGMIVDAVVVEPWGCHPSYAQGHYDRDNDFYVAWEDISRDPAKLEQYLKDYVYGVKDRAEYLAKQPGLTSRLKAKDQICAGVNYGF